MQPDYGIKKSSHVAIVGLAPRTMRLAPDSGIDIWTVNRGVVSVPQADVIFDIHPVLAEQHVKDLADSDKPVFLHAKHPGVPRSIRFPVERLIQRFGYVFNNEIAYLIGFAILLGYTRISLYGVEMDYQSYYQYQRPCVLYFIGYARGLGIHVDWPEEISLTDWGVYGYSMTEILQEADHALAG